VQLGGVGAKFPILKESVEPAAVDDAIEEAGSAYEQFLEVSSEKLANLENFL